ncbi:MAG: hypothetical protein MJ240_07210 [Kiritimatiellae bacterium]|nr:hypothetical protein [Kiritimatiellia bacterium]
MKHVVFQARPVVAALALAAGWSVAAAEYTWTGAAGDQIVTNRLNWVDAEGLVPETPPAREDTIIFDLKSPLTVTNYSGNTDYEYRKLVLRGTANLRFFGYGDCPTNNAQRLTTSSVATYTFHLPLEIVNETASSQLYFNGRDPRVARGTASLYATNIVNVVNAAASVYNAAHIQKDDDYHRVLKIGKGTFYPFNGHNYYTGDMVLQEGTVFYNTHAQRYWYNCHLTFLGDAPGKTFNFQYRNVTGTYNLNGVPQGPDYWSKYIFHVPLIEDGVTTTDHELRSDNGADLVFTNGVTDMTFTGRIRGSLNFHWAPTDVAQTFTYSKGESDTSGALSVLKGRMVMTNGARFTALSRLEVAAGATLELAPGTAIRATIAKVGGVTLATGIYTTVGDGAVSGGGVLVVGDVFTVPYVDATKTATPLDFTGSGFTLQTLTPLLPLPLKLSSEMCISNAAALVTNRMTVARFDAALNLTSEMLRDDSSKVFGLPYTWFELETEGDVTTVYLVARPVVSPVYYQVRKSGVFYDFCTDANFWSDGQLPHPGADYFINATGVYHRASATPSTNIVFGGESLTVNKSLLYPSVTSFDANLRFNAMLDSNDYVFYPYRSGRSVVRGTICGINKCDPLTIRPNGVTGSLFVVESDISCDTWVRFKYTWSTSPKNEFALLGNNLGIKGRIEINGGINTSKQFWQETEVIVTNSAALGGDMDAFAPNGVYFCDFSKLIVSNRLNFATSNRGWAARNGMRVEVAADGLCAIDEPYCCWMQYSAAQNTYIPQRCAVEKTGTGTLMMQRVMPADENYKAIAGNGTNNLVRILEGGIGPLAADAFDRCRMEFVDGTAIVAVPTNAATAAYGLRLLDEAPVFAEGARVRLLPDMTGCEAGSSLSATFLTVPATTPDLTSSLRPAAFSFNGRRWLGRQITKDAVSIDGREYTRYSARFSMSGFVINLR